MKIEKRLEQAVLALLAASEKAETLTVFDSHSEEEHLLLIPRWAIEKLREAFTREEKTNDQQNGS